MHPMLRYLSDRRDNMLERLAQYVQVDSPSSSPEATTRLSKLVGEHAADLGAEVQYHTREGAGSHLEARWRGARPDSGKVLLLCHLDTVWPEGESAHRPFSVSGDRATGPGVFDMKGGVVLALEAVRALREVGPWADPDLVLLCNTDEEIGSPTSRHLIERLACECKAVLVLEPSVPPDGALKTSRKGVGIFKVRVQGKASHAGADPGGGISAIEEIARQIQYLHGLTDIEAGTTVNVGVVQGGSRSNVVADSAFARVDLRVVTTEEGQRMESLILGLRPYLSGARLEITGGMNRPPMERTAGNVMLFEKARAAARDLGFEVAEGSSGGGSDGNFTSALGIPTLDGLGVVGGGAHSLDEWVDLESLAQRAALVACLVQTP